jgi:hypothetical protein
MIDQKSQASGDEDPAQRTPLDPYCTNGTSPPMLETALRHAADGWAVFPGEGKKPLIKGWPKQASQDPKQIEAWWTKWPGANVLGATGQKSGGLVALDIDVNNEKPGEESLSRLEDDHQSLPPTRLHMTGSGGWMYIFRADSEVRNHHSRRVRTGDEERWIHRYPAIDFKGDGGYIVLPDSIHPITRKRYGLANPTAPAPLPDWLSDAVRERAELPSQRKQGPHQLPHDLSRTEQQAGGTKWGLAALRGEYDNVANTVAPGRNDQLYVSAIRVAEVVAGGHVTEEKAKDALRKAAGICGLIDDGDNVDATIESGWRNGIARPRTPRLDNSTPLVDVVNGELDFQGPPPALSELLTEVSEFIRRYVVLNEHQLTALTLWVLHTHVFDAFDTTPYILVSSPEKQCGKTRLIETLQFLVSKPWQTSNPTVAAFFRKISKEKPTLLLDETDAIWAGREENYQELRGALNSGYRQGGSIARCVGQGSKQDVVDFATFCPKLLAGIGKAPDTISDRAIPIRLERKRKSEHTEPFRLRDVRDSSVELRNKIAHWAFGVDREALAQARPETIDGISDRAQDFWEPLLVIAELADATWVSKAQRAAPILGDEKEDDSRAVALLTDIRKAFGDNKQLTTETLLQALTLDKAAQWTVWLNHLGVIEPGAPRKLSKLLSEFAIKPRTLRAGEQTAKGYRREDFEDAWERYL